MGYYLNAKDLPSGGKAAALVNRYGAEVVVGPRPRFEEIPEGMAAVVVIENGPWDAAGLAYCKEEYKAFLDPEDMRPKRLLLVPKDTAYKLSGFNPKEH